jgi:hypothetical protein
MAEKSRTPELESTLRRHIDEACAAAELAEQRG